MKTMRTDTAFILTFAFLSISIALSQAHFVEGSLQDIWDGRVAYYPCEHNSTYSKVTDQGTYRNNVTLQGSTTGDYSKHGVRSCKSEPISTPSPSPFTGGADIDSFEGWFYLIDPSENFENLFAMYDNSNNEITYVNLLEGMEYFDGQFLYAGQVFKNSPNFNYPEGRWIHLIITQNSSNHRRAYVNGTLVDASTNLGAYHGNLLTKIRLGGAEGSTNLHGVFDDFLFTSHRYTAQDVIDSYNASYGVDYISLFDSEPYIPTPEIFYNVTNCSDLKEFNRNTSGKYFVINDIDCAGYDWGATGQDAFTAGAVLDGQGYTISNLYIDDATDENYVFSGITGKVIIKNLDIYNWTSVNRSSDYEGFLFRITTGGGGVLHLYNISVEKVRMLDTPGGAASTGAGFFTGEDGNDYYHNVSIHDMLLDCHDECSFLGGRIQSSSFDYVQVRDSTIRVRGTVGRIGGIAIGSLGGTKYLNYTYVKNITYDSVPNTYSSAYIGGLMGDGYISIIKNSYVFGFNFDCSSHDSCGALVGRCTSGTFTTNLYMLNDSRYPLTKYCGEGYNPLTDYVDKLLFSEFNDTASFPAWDFVDIFTMYDAPIFSWTDYIPSDNSFPVIDIGTVTSSEGVYAIGDTIEYSPGNHVFQSQVTHPSLTWVYVRVSNSTGVMYADNQSSDFPLTFNGTLFSTGSPFEYYISAGNGNGLISEDDASFLVNDSVSPLCTGLVNLTAVNGTEKDITGVCMDYTLASFNLSCAGVPIYSVNITSASFTVETEAVFTSNGTSCSWSSCDGFQNCAVGSFQVTVIPPPPPPSMGINSCPETIPGGMVLGIMTALVMFLLIMGVMAHPVFGIIGGMLLITLSWILHGCQSFLGWGTAGAGLIFIIYFALSE